MSGDSGVQRSVEVRHVRERTAFRPRSCFYAHMPHRQAYQEFPMSPDAIVPVSPAAIRCLLMLVVAVSIVVFQGEFVQYAVAGTF
jgi:hypothetical protein